MQLSSFDEWVNTLTTAMDKAKVMGMSKDELKRSAVEMGNFLYANITPDLPENRLLKAMWEVADQSEKEVLATTLIRLCEKHGKH